MSDVSSVTTVSSQALTLANAYGMEAEMEGREDTSQNNIRLLIYKAQKPATADGVMVPQS